MEFYIAVAYNDPAHLCEIARTAEEAGFGGIVVSDHMIYPGDLKTPYPYTSHGRPRWEHDTPWPEPMVAVGAMSAVTTRLRFLCSIYLLGLRHPVMAAKSVSTAAVMSNNRLTLGVGAGWMREEFDLLGVPFEKRGRRLTECIEVFRKVLAGGVVEHHGEFFDFEPVEMSPVPTQTIPIYGGGTSKPALRRAAALCDGWASEIQTTEELDRILAELAALRTEAGRAASPFGICAALRDVYDADGYRAMRDRGVSELITVPWLFYGDGTQSCEQKCDGIRRFADEVVSRL
ncbi:MAG: TIGR03619 family F420-dependent LLM class oxidoreductase [Myxococcota bacterium]|jgi:probable F420-dependent oxidoreductase|nr:TIGR03619 family F420-dependent LLM class oxidoreductase [Myxococcota bacterium]